MTQHEQTIELLDVVALTDDVPEKGLIRGQVGTVVEILAPGVFEVEFSDDWGQSCGLVAFSASQLMVLHYQPLQTSLAMMDRSMEDIKEGRVQPVKTAIRQIADKLGLKLDR